MHWIEERILEHNEGENRKHRISTESPKIYDALWTYVVEDIGHANGTEYIGGFKIDIEGNAPLRDVTIFRFSGRERSEVKIVLSRDKHSIQISGAVTMIFPVRICPDETVCLKDDHDKRIEIKDAARRILDPFLFPHLQDHKPDAKTKELTAEEQDAWRRIQRAEGAGA